MNISLCVKLYAPFHICNKLSEDLFAFFDGEDRPAMEHEGFEVIGEDHLGGEEIKLCAFLEPFESDGILRFLTLHEVLNLRESKDRLVVARQFVKTEII